LLDAKTSFSAIFGQIRTPLLLNTAAQAILIGANLLLFVNFARTACACCCRSKAASTPSIFRQPSTLEAPAS
jgi:hypothetical protein